MIKIYLWISMALIVVSINVAKNILPDHNYRSDYVYDLIKHANWPRNKETGPFVIGVLGDSNITKELKVLASKKNGSKSIVVNQLEALDQMENCSMVYIPSNQMDLPESIMTRIKSKGIIVVTEENKLLGTSVSVSQSPQDKLTKL